MNILRGFDQEQLLKYAAETRVFFLDQSFQVQIVGTAHGILIKEVEALKQQVKDLVKMQSENIVIQLQKGGEVC